MFSFSVWFFIEFRIWLVDHLRIKTMANLVVLWLVAFLSFKLVGGLRCDEGKTFATKYYSAPMAFLRVSNSDTISTLAAVDVFLRSINLRWIAFSISTIHISSIR